MDAVPALWGHLAPGPYAVGHRTVYTYDLARPALAEQRALLPTARAGRAMQVNCWYPAVEVPGPRRTFTDYLDLAGHEVQFAPLLTRDRYTLITRLLAHPLAHGAEVNLPGWAAFVAAAVPLAAHGAARPAAGRFPLVLLAPAPAVEWCLLAEVLASHGYVLLTCPLAGPFEKEGNWQHPGGIETAVRDLEFLLAQARTLPYADADHLGVIGAGTGALAATGLAMRQPTVQAVVSLDGALGSAAGGEQLSRTPFYDPARIDKPILHIYNPATPHTSLRSFDAFKYAARHLLPVSQMRPLDFYTYGMLERLIPRAVGAPLGDPQPGFEWAARYTVQFLHAYLQDDPAALAFLQQSPAANGAPPGLQHEIPAVQQGLTLLPPLPVPPGEREMRALITRLGFAGVAGLYAQYRAHDPQPFPPATFVGVGGQLLAQGDHAAARQWAGWFGESYPDAAVACYLRARAEGELGERAAAATHFRRALELLPADPYLSPGEKERYRQGGAARLAALGS